MSASVKKTERWFPNSMPVPFVDPHTYPWWQACAEHRLTTQHCKQCHHAQLPPAPICSECQSNDLELVTLNGNGTLYTYTAVYQPIAMEQKLPFIIAVVELDVSGTPCKNRVRLMTNMVDAAENELKIDQSVRIAWEMMSEFVSIPRFKLVNGL